MVFILGRERRFGIYSITLNKTKLYPELSHNKERVYNYIARLIFDKIPFEKALDRINLLIDKSKSRREVTEFNEYIIRQLQGRIEPKVPLDIEHKTSHENLGIQLADLFCWGIFRKYEKNDLQWFNVFKEKILCDKLFL